VAHAERRSSGGGRRGSVLQISKQLSLILDLDLGSYKLAAQIALTLV
jgi:hypothetical protein